MTSLASGSGHLLCYLRINKTEGKVGAEHAGATPALAAHQKALAGAPRNKGFPALSVPLLQCGGGGVGPGMGPGGG